MTTDISRSPCRECLCLAVCRHKTITTLTQDCFIVWTYLHMSKKIDLIKYIHIRDDLNPTHVSWDSLIGRIQKELKKKGLEL